jgi:hypothetical protein
MGCMEISNSPSLSIASSSSIAPILIMTHAQLAQSALLSKITAEWPPALQQPLHQRSTPSPTATAGWNRQLLSFFHHLIYSDRSGLGHPPPI